jgi:sigma-B regulation protein RsbU (phosphoserine phosphatase)
VLGLRTRTVYEERTMRLEPGDVLVAITDGITEAEDADGRRLEEEVVLEAVRDHPDVSSSDLAGHIIRAVDAFTSGAAPADDRTVVVVRVAGAESLVYRPARDRELAHAIAC